MLESLIPFIVFTDQSFLLRGLHPATLSKILDKMKIIELSSFFIVDDIHETAVQADLSDPVQVTDADCCTSSGKTFLMTSISSDTTSRFLVGDNNGALTIFRGLTQGDFVVDVRVTETDPGNGS